VESCPKSAQQYRERRKEEKGAGRRARDEKARGFPKKHMKHTTAACRADEVEKRWRPVPEEAAWGKYRARLTEQRREEWEYEQTERKVVRRRVNAPRDSG